MSSSKAGATPYKRIELQDDDEPESEPPSEPPTDDDEPASHGTPASASTKSKDERRKKDKGNKHKREKGDTSRRKSKEDKDVAESDDRWHKESRPEKNGDAADDVDDTIPERDSSAAPPVSSSGSRQRKHRKGIVVQKLAHKKAMDAVGGGSTSHGGGDRKSRKVKDLVNSTIANLGASRFEKWKNEELVLLLVKNGVEVRNELDQAHSSLVAMADQFFHSIDMPDKPTPYTKFDLERIDPIVRRIQEFFINRSAQRREAVERETLMARPGDGDESQYADLDIMEILMAESQEDGADGDDSEYDAASGSDGNKWWFANPIKAKKSNKSYVKQSARDIEAGLGLDVDADASTGKASEFGRESTYDFADGDLIDPDDKERYKRNRKAKSRAVQILDIPWRPPDWHKAKDYMNYNRPRQGGKGGHKFHFRSTTTGRHCTLGGCGEVCDILREGQTSEFGIYGPGVTNYFKFTKWLFWLFFVLSILATPELMLNFLGPDHSSSGLTDLYTTSAGNLAPKTFNETIYITVPLCPWARAASLSLFTQDFNCAITRNTLGVFYSGFDILICITVLAGFAWIRFFEKQEEVLLDKNTVFASMYTLQVKNLPQSCDEAKLRHHIRDVLGNQKCVVAVHMAVDNKAEFDFCIERGSLIKERTRLINRHRYETTRIRQKASSNSKNPESLVREGEAHIKKLRKVFIRDCMEVDKKLRAVESGLRGLDGGTFRPICAFVTFDSVYHLEKCLQAFASKKFWSCASSNRTAPLEGKELVMLRAPEPSTIIWENLRFTFNDRMTRRNLTTALALLLILISVVCTYIAKILQDRAQVTSGTALCPGNFQDMSRAQQQAAVRADKQILHCYCDRLSYAEKGTDPDCQELIKQEVNTELVTYFASIIVLLVNIVMEFAMQGFSLIEKHQSEDTQGRSVLMRLFALKYINTSCVFLVNSNIQGLGGLTVSNNSVEFSKDWYKSVGVSILLVQIGNIALSHAKKFYDYFMYKRAIRRARRDEAQNNASALTQDELNKLHEGPVFEFPINYAQLMVTYFVCLTFSAGMPILYVIGMVNFGFTYLVDKYLFINLYRTPNRFSTKIGRMATTLVPWGVVVHLCMAIWALSNKSIFTSSTSAEAAAVLGDSHFTDSSASTGLTTANLQSKVYLFHTFPLFVLLVLIVLLRVVFMAMENLGSAGGALVNAVFDGGFDTVAKDSVAYQVGYSRAVHRNLIKGLTTYNILHNTKYKELFQISWKFAFAHHHLRSVRMDKPVVTDDFEFDAAKVERQRRATAFAPHALGLSEKTSPRDRNASTASAYSSSASVYSRPSAADEPAYREDPSDHEHGSSGHEAVHSRTPFQQPDVPAEPPAYSARNAPPPPPPKASHRGDAGESEERSRGSHGNSRPSHSDSGSSSSHSRPSHSRSSHSDNGSSSSHSRPSHSDNGSSSSHSRPSHSDNGSSSSHSRPSHSGNSHSRPRGSGSRGHGNSERSHNHDQSSTQAPSHRNPPPPPKSRPPGL